QALDLAKQLHRLETTPANRELLLNTYLGRARQLRGQGHTRDAVTTLQAAVAHGPFDNAWTERLAQELAASGAVKPALDLLNGMPEAPAVAAVLGHAADAALALEAAGRAQLPEALREDCDRVLRAFAEVEQGHDEAARQTLQPVGLRSPFL